MIQAKLDVITLTLLQIPLRCREIAYFRVDPLINDGKLFIITK